MSADDRKNDSPSDPWADILGDGPSEPAAELDFSFADPSDPPPVADDSFAPADSGEESPAEVEVAADAERREDELVDAWLEEADRPEDATPDALTPPEDSGSWPGDGGGQEAVADDVIDDWTGLGTAQDEQPSFADTAALDGAAGAAVVAAATTPRPAANALKAKKKKAGLGQMIGGGLLAIPLTLGILIWGFQKDVFGVTKHVPKSVAFLLPRKFQPAATVTRSPAPRPDPGPTVTPTPSETPVDETAGTDPEPEVTTTPAPVVGDAEPVTPVVTETAPPDEPIGDVVAVTPPDVGAASEAPPAAFPDPLAALPDPVAAFPDPTPTMPEPPVATPQPPVVDEAEIAAVAAAADRRQVDAAVEEALAAVAALERGGAGDESRKALLVDCYKRLAKVGEELVMLEQMSADAGRPISEPPRSVVDLHGRLGRHREDLARLGRNWLDYSKRSMPGVVLPVTFQASRKVGPYWSSKVTLEMPQGSGRELAVISRSEPAAVQGDAVLLMGIVFDGDVIWAADVRPPAEPGRLDAGF